MDLLLDTHTLIWFFEGDTQLSEKAKNLIQDPENQNYLSAASIWEMTIKQSLGKLELSKPVAEILTHILNNGVALIDITAEHALKVGELPYHHRDPFDRILIAQSIYLNIPIISKDLRFDDYINNRLW
jgi:PIN domain nuclease of toxin-antitoxin system